MLAPTCPPWYVSPLRDWTLMNKSPEFDMLKEPAEPENTQRQKEEKEEEEEEKRRRKTDRRAGKRDRGTEKEVKMIMHKQKSIEWVSLKGQLLSWK